MTRRKRVYVSGPLNGDGKTSKEENVKKAAEVGRQLLAAGYAPFIPHLTWYADPDDVCGYDNWIESDLAWVSVAEALFRMSGNSSGADKEVEHAIQQGIPVIHSESPILREFGPGSEADLALALEPQSILAEAQRLVYGQRNRHYGHPRDNFRVIAMLWTTYLKEVGVAYAQSDVAPIEPRHVAMMMILMKVARDVNMPKRDNIVDIAGYAATADRLLEEE